MKIIKSEAITKAVKELCIEASFVLPMDVRGKIETLLAETDSKCTEYMVLQKICENADYAKCENIPICQDTGICIVFCDVEIGRAHV